MFFGFLLKSLSSLCIVFASSMCGCFLHVFWFLSLMWRQVKGEASLSPTLTCPYVPSFHHRVHLLPSRTLGYGECHISCLQGSPCISFQRGARSRSLLFWVSCHCLPPTPHISRDSSAAGLSGSSSLIWFVFPRPLRVSFICCCSPFCPCYSSGLHLYLKTCYLLSLGSGWNKGKHTCSLP